MTKRVATGGRKITNKKARACCLTLRAPRERPSSGSGSTIVVLVIENPIIIFFVKRYTSAHEDSYTHERCTGLKIIATKIPINITRKKSILLY